MKAIITKYAISSGVKLLDGTTSEQFPTSLRVINSDYSWFFHGGEWHETKHSAINKVIEMFAKKRKSLEKQLKGLESKEAKALAAIREMEL